MSRKRRAVLILIAAAALCVLMGVIGYAAGMIIHEVRDSYFRTGTIDVEIRTAGAPPGDLVSLFDPDVKYEPGMRVRGNYEVRNLSTDEAGVYCRLFFAQLDGPLQDVLVATITDSDGNVLYEGPVNQLAQARDMEEPFHMPMDSVKTFTLELYYPSNAGNASQGQHMSFALGVTAVQATNYPEGGVD